MTVPIKFISGGIQGPKSNEDGQVVSMDVRSRDVLGVSRVAFMENNKNLSAFELDLNAHPPP